MLVTVAGWCIQALAKGFQSRGLLEQEVVNKVTTFNKTLELTKEEQSGGIELQTKLKNSRLPTWKGCLGCQQAAGYRKAWFLFYLLKILPTYPVT